MRAPRPSLRRLRERFLLVHVQVLGELVERHLGVDLAPIAREQAHERGIALTPHGEGRDVSVLDGLAEERLVPAPVRDTR